VRVLVCGSRTWRRWEVIERRLRELPPRSEVIHGGARGADLLAAGLAVGLGLDVTEYPADWRGEGKRAGVLRNLAMLNSEPDLVLAFWDGLSLGTAHVVREARARGIATEVFTLERVA
jgi:hypothetical protein